VSFSILTNTASLQAQQYLNANQAFQSKTIQQVTSGLRIVNSGDDAAGLAIANGDRSTEAVLTQGILNANDGLSQLQIVDGGINNISQLLDRASTLATQSASGTFTGNRAVLDSEFQSVVGEINREAQSIGLAQNGALAQSLQVFIGGGEKNNGISAINNGSVSLDLSKSTVDAQSLGLTGVQSIGVAGTDIGSGSPATSLSAILGNTANSSSAATAGFSTFILKGPGFANNGVAISVNTANLGGTSDLVSAVNAAIQGAADGGTQSATALKNASISASINTDSTGKQQLVFSSSTAAFQVQAGDREANALLGNFAQNAVSTGTDNNPTANTSTNKTLTLAIDGGTAFTVTVTSGATTSKGQIVNDLNANTTFAAGATASLTGNQLVITSKGNSAASAITFTGTALATTLGLTSATAASASTGSALSATVQGSTAATAQTATAAESIQVNLQGAGLTSPVNLSVAVATGATTANALATLQSQVAGNAALQAAGITLSTATVGNNLVFTSAKGEQFQVAATGDTQNLLGLGSFLTNTSSGNTFDYTSITAGTDFTTASPGTGTANLEVSLNGLGSSSNLIAVNLDGAITGGAAATEDNAIAQINSAIAANSSLASAGLQAKDNGSGSIELISNNNTFFRVGAYGADVGFGATGATFTGNAQSAAPATSQYFNSQGASATADLAYSDTLYGSDNQTIAVTGLDAAGAKHSVGITLQNNTTARQPTIDQAISQINTQLQQSNDPTLQSIVAVKDDKAGVQSIRFLSTLSSFQVSVGSDAGGTGVTPPTGNVASSATLGTGLTASVGTQTNAEAAVGALANAVTLLGSAQAVVGRGENQFNYAVNLAQSQLTNVSAAESGIRDADLASAAANLTKAQILVQAGVAALAQANSAPQQILSLLKS
jgi:flagellin